MEAAAPWLAVGLPLLLVFAFTASRDLGIIDSGELGAVCAGLGIAHPTGYPLYTLLGRLAVLLWPGQAIVAGTVLSLLAAVAAAVLTAQAARELLESRMADSVRPEREDQALRASLRWISWGAGLWFGTSQVLMDQATGNEVYALHLVFVALLVILGQRLLRPGATGRTFLLFAWVVGLAFSHHLSVAFLVPALLYAVVRFLVAGGILRGPRGGLIRLVALGAGCALLAWSIQLYLPIRSLRDPMLDWGDPTSWRRFWHHVMAGQYRVWFFESGHLWWGNLLGYLGSLPARFSWPFLALCVPGGYALFRRRSPHLWFHALIFVVTLAWAASYSIHDLAPYFLPADLVLSVLAALGAVVVVRFLARSRPSTAPGGVRVAASRASLAALALALAVGGLQGALHFARADRSSDRLVRFNTEAVFRNLPEDSILLSRHWDGLVSASLYMQNVEGFRRDVTVVDPELLRRSWYYGMLRRHDPDLLRPMEDRVEVFVNQALLFEAGKPYNAAIIQAAYLSVLDGIAQLQRPRRPTCFTPDVEASFLRQAAPVPEGLVFVLRDDPAASPALAPPDVEGLRRAGFRKGEAIHRQIAEQWADMLAARIRFLEATGRTAEAGPWAAALASLRQMLAGS